MLKTIDERRTRPLNRRVLHNVIHYIALEPCVGLKLFTNCFSYVSVRWAHPWKTSSVRFAFLLNQLIVFVFDRSGTLGESVNNFQHILLLLLLFLLCCCFCSMFTVQMIENESFVNKMLRLFYNKNILFDTNDHVKILLRSRF